MKITRGRAGDSLSLIHIISTAYRDKVTDDLKFVENKPGVHKPDPILVADNVTRKFGGMTAVDVSCV